MTKRLLPSRPRLRRAISSGRSFCMRAIFLAAIMSIFIGLVVIRITAQTKSELSERTKTEGPPRWRTPDWLVGSWDCVSVKPLESTKGQVPNELAKVVALRVRDRGYHGLAPETPVTWVVPAEFLVKETNGQMRLLEESFPVIVRSNAIFAGPVDMCWQFIATNYLRGDLNILELRSRPANTLLVFHQSRKAPSARTRKSSAPN